MRAYFVRHGESEANILRVISNRGSIHGLTEKGRRQAIDLAHRLKDESVTQVYTSPLLRAVETAEVLSAEFSLTYSVTDGLREPDCGEIEGRGDPESWGVLRAVEREWMEDRNLEARIPGGESYLDIQTRFFSFIESELMTLDEPTGSAIMVGHGMVFYLMLPLLFVNIDYEIAGQYSIGNTGYALGERSDKGWICREWFGFIPAGQ